MLIKTDKDENILTETATRTTLSFFDPESNIRSIYTRDKLKDDNWTFTHLVGGGVPPVPPCGDSSWALRLPVDSCLLVDGPGLDCFGDPCLLVDLDPGLDRFGGFVKAKYDHWTYTHGDGDHPSSSSRSSSLAGRSSSNARCDISVTKSKMILDIVHSPMGHILHGRRKS